MKHKGYDDALALGFKILSELNAAEVEENTMIRFDGEFIFPWLGQKVALGNGSTEEKIIWLHYLAARGPKTPRGKYINYKQVPGAAIYYDNFVKRAINPMVKAFASDLELFLRLGMSLGGTEAGLGHKSFTLNVLPCVPITYVIWQGDDEVPSSGNILFDESIVEWLCAEDVVALAGIPVYKMLSACAKPN